MQWHKLTLLLFGLAAYFLLAAIVSHLLARRDLRREKLLDAHAGFGAARTFALICTALCALCVILTLAGA